MSLKNGNGNRKGINMTVKKIRETLKGFSFTLAIITGLSAVGDYTTPLATIICMIITLLSIMFCLRLEHLDKLDKLKKRH